MKIIIKIKTQRISWNQNFFAFGKCRNLKKCRKNYNHHALHIFFQIDECKENKDANGSVNYIKMMMLQSHHYWNEPNSKCNQKWAESVADSEKRSEK